MSTRKLRSVKASDILPAQSEEDPVAHAINEASFAAGNLVYDFAGRFDRREDYRPVEELAQRVQAIVVQTATRILKHSQKQGGS